MVERCFAAVTIIVLSRSAASVPPRWEPSMATRGTARSGCAGSVRPAGPSPNSRSVPDT